MFRPGALLLAVALLDNHVTTGLVPLPASVSSGDDTPTPPLPLSPAFTIATADGAAPGPVLSAAFQRFEALLFAHGGRSTGQTDRTAADETVLRTLAVNVSAGEAQAAGAAAAPQLDGDESYSLHIGAAGGTATLAAPTLQGALHGLQTFSQLCRYDYDTERVVIDRAPWTIDDRPRFSHRGLMLDTSRHFYPPRAIIQLLDAMSAVKLSVFHWHLVDSTSFPLHVPGTNLSAGAWSPSQRYSRHDVEMVVEAATERAIRVVPEFDLPAHTAPAWCVGEPGICTSSGSAIDPSSPRLCECCASLRRAMALGADSRCCLVWRR